MYLAKLKIENLALVDSIDIDFAKKWSCVTGETGAGKSMILGALRLLLGGRADVSLIRKGAERAIVEGVFLASDKNDICEHEWKNTLAETGFELESEEPIIIRRELTKTGRSIAQIAGRLVTAKQLAALTKNIIDIHSQHDHQSLIRRAEQRRALDSFASAKSLLNEVAATYKKWRKAENEYNELAKRERQLRREEDLLKFQFEEISSAKLQTNEDKELLQKEKSLANAEEIGNIISELTALLENDDHGVLSNLRIAQREFMRLKNLDPVAEKLGDSLSQSLIELGDFNQQLASYEDGIETNPKKLTAVQNRIDIITQLKKKYGETLNEIIAFADEVEKKLSMIENFDEHVAELKLKTENAKITLDKSAAKLTKKRAAAAKKLSMEIKRELKTLGLKDAKFVAQMQTLNEISATGAEGIEFLISVNPGEDAKPLAKVVSGGELSRITLALKCIMTNSDDVPILVFDEIDAGISGTVAHAVGERLKKLSSNHQIFVITHMPQIASRSENHFTVTKKIHNGRTSVTIDKLDKKEREKEIARMLGGESKTTIAHAKELLNN
ncbi:MAG: DNA repair protein RecN [Chlamydiae bacterium]|nr:MAG: DNA repair protein RecN [Chlamydiota bacterium]